MHPIRINVLQARLCFLGASGYGLTTAFAQSSWINFSVIGASIIAIVALMKMLTEHLRLVDSNFVILLTLCLVISTLLSVAIVNAPFEDKLVSHTLARLFSIFALYMLPYILLQSDVPTATAMQRGLTVALCITLLLIVYDYLRLNGLLDLGAVSHMGSDEEILATARGSIYRARGGSYEPGHDAAVISAILPIALAQIRTSLRIVVAILISLVTYLLGFSISLVIWLIIFTAIYLYLSNASGFKFRLFALLRVVIVCGGFIYLLNALEIIADISDKFFSESYAMRADSFLDILAGSTHDLSKLLFGYGPGGYLILEVSAVTNTFASFLLDVGIVGLTFYCLAILFTFRQLLRINNPIYTAGFVAYVIVFVNAIGNYWFPSHWLFLLYPCFAKLYRVPYNLQKSTI